MKKIASTCLGSLPEFNSDDKVTHVWGRDAFIALSSPIRHNEINCPTCGESNGYKVKDSSQVYFIGWSCLNPSCGIKLSKTVSCDYRSISLADCGVQEGLQEACFEKMEQEDKSIIQKLKQFCNFFKGFLLLPGSSGTGKTYASVCCMKEFLKKHDECCFVNTANLYVKWLALKQEGTSELPLVHRLSEYRLLVLDDLGTRTPTEAFLDFIYLITNNRSTNQNVGTIISTNLNHADMREKLGDAITSRICSGMIVKFNGKDKRLPMF